MRRSPRSRAPTPAASGTSDLAAQLFGRRPEDTLALLRAVWPKIVGPELARRTEVLALDRRTLRVRVPDGHWRGVLHRMRGPILERLRARAGRLAPTALGFHEGQPTGPPEERPSDVGPPPEPLDLDVPLAVAEAAAAIADPVLRDAFTRTAARYLHAKPRGTGR